MTRGARRDRLNAAALAAVAVAYLLAGRRYPLDTLANPGPGVFPLAAGVALLALALGQLVAPGRGSSAARSAAPGPTRASLLMAATLCLFAAALPRVGFLPASLALVFLAARLMGLPGWWRPAALAAGVTLACRVLFVSWLGVRLP
jgi:hypothetical protein